MNGQEFIGAVKSYFSAFLEELGFVFGESKSSGRLYDVQFDHPQYRLSISYEPGDDYLLIVLLTQSHGTLSTFEDGSTTLRLSDLKAKFMPPTSEEKSENNVYFADVVAGGPVEKELLKSARELRLCLKKLLE